MSSVEYVQIADEPLDDLLLALEAGRASVVVRINSSDGGAELSVEGGTLCSATFGSRRGVEAILSVSNLRDGSYSLEWAGKKDPLAGTLFHPSSGRNDVESAPVSGISVRSVLARRGEGSTTPLMMQELQTTDRPLSEVHRQSSLARYIVTALKEPKTGLELVRGRSERPTKVLRILRLLLAEGYIRSLSIPPESSRRPAVFRSRAIRIENDAPPFRRATTPPTRLIFAKPKSEAASANTPEGHPSRGDVKSPLNWSFGLGMLRRLRAATVEERKMAQPPRRQQSPFKTPPFFSQRPSSPQRPFSPQPPSSNPSPYRLGEIEAPVPSSHFEMETLQRLEKLDGAVGNFAARDDLRTRRYTARSKPDILASTLPIAPTSTFLGHAGEDVEETSATSRNLPPRVGRYEILARLRKGEHASVFLCRLSGNAGFERLFAMKVLDTPEGGTNGALSELFREARVLAALHHPNVVGVADVGTPETPYLVLDYVEGGSLFELLRATPRERNPALLVPILLDALSGLHAVHQARDPHGRPMHLVHGNVTPHNLLVGADGTCRVTDFGIARAADDAGIQRSSPARSGYLAPEALPRRAVDHRSDIFSMGVVLYSALTGVDPFPAELAEGALQSHLDGKLLPPSTVGLCPPACFDFLIMKALAKNPEDRFTSAEQMMVLLRKVAAHFDLLAPPSQVSAWVSSVLEPFLLARRAAVR